MADIVTELKSRVTIRDLGTPKPRLNRGEKLKDGENAFRGKTLDLGFIFGVADRVHARVDGNGNPFDDLEGEFVVTPTTKPLRKQDDGSEIAIDRMVAQRFSLGGSPVINTVISMLRSKPNSVEFAVKVTSRHAKNALGYEYVVEPIFQPRGSSRLTHLDTEISNLRKGPEKEAEGKDAKAA